MRTTIPDRKAPCPLDRVNRPFKTAHPHALWVSDFTDVSTWQGWLYVAFVIDVFARRIGGLRVSRSMPTDFVPDALEQALYARPPERDHALIHHSDRGSQDVSIRYTERSSEAGMEPSVGSKGDPYDNALAEIINGLYQAKLIHRRAPWKTREAGELAARNGCPLLITIGSLSLSGLCRRRKLRHTITDSSRKHRKRPDLNPTASAIAVAVHFREVNVWPVTAE